MKSSYDPNLTSWALNELSPAERADFEEELKKNPALMAEAQTTQTFCRFVQNHLLDEKAALTDAQRARLKSAASATSTLRRREEREPHGTVIRAKSAQWWRRPAFVLPLSAAAAILLSLLPYLTKKMSPDNSNVLITATATPKPEPKRSVLSPTTTSEPAAHAIATTQSSEPVPEVESGSTSTPREPIEISMAQLKASAPGAAKIVKPGAGVLAMGGNMPDTGASLARIGSGSVLTLTGINTYTGGLAVNGGVLRVGWSSAPTSSEYLGEPTTTRGTVSTRAGRLNRTTSGSISELGDLSDFSEKANIMVNGGVSHSPGAPGDRTP